MNIVRAFGFVAASLVLAAPLSAMAEETAAQPETLQCTGSELGIESLESSEALGGTSDGDTECRPILQSCSVNSQCCGNLCLLGLCI